MVSVSPQTSREDEAENDNRVAVKTSFYDEQATLGWCRSSLVSRSWKKEIRCEEG